MKTRDKKINNTKDLNNNFNVINQTKQGNVRNYYINQKNSYDDLMNQSKTIPENTFIVRNAPTQNYNEVEQFVLDLLNEGYDLIDTLILTREHFDTDKLDNYLFEMRDKGLI